MGKTTGFIEYGRREATHRAPMLRVKDYNEFLVPPTKAEIHLQSARCMDCGVPFCHTGIVVQGQSVGCPLNNLIPETNDLLYRGDVDAACARLLKTHPFPEITGRVCPALCEGSCTLGEHEQPVTVKDIERYLADAAIEKGLAGPYKVKNATGRRVAVVGSGPAGLACADRLSRLGDAATVFERDEHPGGFLMYGIPNMKLDKAIVRRRVELLRQQGVEFVLGCEVGGTRTPGSLMREFDAVVLCTGARGQRLLSAPGAEAKGVYTAVDYLAANTRRLLNGEAGQGYIDAAGKDVVVVGGGDTGTDCVATAIRQGASSVLAIEIMPCPPQIRAEQNPWPLWPRVFKTEYGHEEAIALFGQDVRQYETTVKEVLAEKGRVTGVVTVQVAWHAAPDGHNAPREIPGTERRHPAQLVLTAMGFTGPEKPLLEALELPLTARGLLHTTQGDSAGVGGYRTALPTVFAAGDVRRGPSLVVWAILEGGRAAVECHNYLASLNS